MTGQPKASIVIPAYNEAESIEQTIDQIKAIEGDFEVIVVDDGSTDGTADLIDDSEVVLIRHSANRGYGAALKSGIRRASSDTIVITDADGTYPIDRIMNLVDIYHQEKADMVVGARIGKEAAIPLIRRPAKWCINKLANYLTRTRIVDLNSGLRVMNRQVVNKYLKLLPDGFSFTTTITLAMLCNGHPVVYEPIVYYSRQGKSKIRPIQDTLNFIQLILRTVLYFDPLRIFVPLATPILLAGLGLVAYQAVVNQNITTAALLLFLSGVQVMAIGMLADLIVRRE